MSVAGEKTPGCWPKPVAATEVVAKAKGAEAIESNSVLLKTIKRKETCGDGWLDDL